MTTITLAMIVKNEAHCITQSLESVLPHINYWIICDNGSTDNTELIAKSILKNIPGEYHYVPWIDFSTNRNQSLDLAKDKADYTLILDADDYLVVKEQLPNLNQPTYQMMIHHHNTFYPRVQLINNKFNFKFVGAVHEYLDTKNSISPLLENIYIQYQGLGSRSKDPNKYLNDAKLLEKILFNNLSDNEISRNTFYCAQSYRDAGVFDQALKYYLLRTNQGGWQDEIYISFLNVAKIIQYLNYNQLDIINSYMRVINHSPNRIEGYYYLANYCRNNSMFDLAYYYSLQGSKLNKLKTSLFQEEDIYDWKIFDELSLSAYSIGKFQEAISVNSQILNKVPVNETDRIKNNLLFCLKKFDIYLKFIRKLKIISKH